MAKDPDTPITCPGFFTGEKPLAVKKGRVYYLHMYPTTFSHNFKKGLLIFTAILLLGLIYPTYQWLSAPTSAITDPSQLNFGLWDDGIQGSGQLGGYLYLYATPRANAAAVAESGLPLDTSVGAEAGFYAYSMATDDILLVPIIPEDTAIPGLAVMTSENAVNPADAEHPGWIDYEANLVYTFNTPSLWNESMPVVAAVTPADRQFVVYEGQIEDLAPAGAEALLDLDNWNIVIHNPFTDDTRIIENAGRPVWLNGEADILYLKTDGIYRYNLAADASQRVENRWENLDRAAQLAITDDSAAFILTVPGLSSIAVYTFTDSVNGELALNGIIADAGNFYFNPVFAPDNRHYAVQVQNENDWDASTNSYTSTRIEVRNLFERERVNVVTPETTLAPQTILLDWRTALAPFESTLR